MGLAVLWWGCLGVAGVHPATPRSAAQPALPAAPGTAVVAWPLPAPRPRLDPAVEPLDVAWDAEAGVLVADAVNGAVVGYDAAGARRHAWRFGDGADGTACGALPVALAVDARRERVFVLWHLPPPDGSRTVRAVLEERDPEGVAHRRVPIVADDIAVDPDTGNLWAVDALGGRVTEWRMPDAVPARSIAIARQPGAAASIAITPARVAVVVNRAVELFERDGRRLGRPDLGGQPAHAVAADEAGRLWVLLRPGGAFTDTSTAPLIRRFGPVGTAIDAVPHAALGAQPLPAAVGWPFALDAAGDAPVFTTGREQGPFEVRWHADLAGPARVVVGGRTRAVRPAPRCRAATGGAPPAIAAALDGALIVLDTAGHQLVALDPGRDGAADTLAEAPAGALDIAAGGDGAVYVLAAGGDVLALRRDGRPGPPWRLVCACGRGDRIAVGGRSLFVSQPEPLPGRIQWRSTRTGAAIGDIALPAGTGGRWPADVAAAPDGEVVFAGGLIGGTLHAWDIVRGRATDGPIAAWGAGVGAGPRRVAAARTPDGETVVAALRSDGSIAVFGAGGDLHAAWRPRSVDGVPIAADDLAIAPDGRVFVVEAGRRAVLGFAAAGDAADVGIPPPAAPTPGPAACVPVVRRRVPSGPVAVGDVVDVGLSVDAACPAGGARGADVVVVLDRSGSMTGEPLDAAVAAARAFVEGLDHARHRVALVTFSDAATADAPLGFDPAAVIAALGELRADGGTDIAAALAAVDGVLQAAAPVPGAPDRLPVAVVLSDGGHGNPATDPRAAAAGLRARGVVRFAIGLGDGADAGLLADIADGQYFPAPAPGDLAPIYQAIQDRIASPGIGDVILDERPGPHHALVPGSASPAARRADGGLRWGRAVLPSGGLTVTYRITARLPGRWTVGAASVGVFADAAGRVHPLQIPTAELQVDVPPAPTATAGTAGTPGAPTRPPPGTPGVRTARIFLPHADGCAGPAPPMAAMLVLDASTSMLERLPGAGRTKLDGARAALGAWLDAVRWDGGDRVGLVTFHRRADLAAPLGRDRAAIDAALAAVGVDGQTRLDLGIERAHAALAADARAGAGGQAVIVVLTDGRPFPAPGASAVAAARAARSDGIRVVAVGLGDEIDVDTLRAVVGVPGDFLRAASDDDLVAGFRALGGSLACRRR